ncbi:MULTISPECIES: enoyl-CoA hydratase-related protein [Marichromatium]|uniref:Methylglutaconyl-CoA hydratase n=1 Tax=Marichromatium gracile TaxID=1048 RepID=A0A4R4A829_MARGR|nr:MULTISPECIES: enoyl-CoA hydratase-related protein [Marichromatium]MBK1709525.1 enoyl-CoA hydratase [Marichromatium gracile]RNE90105.1 enoyl-CoA hydratase/isomerase family protein [Marichromatium sp. AB31]RNE94551.1 enoyl-CoA hydratase/isomerase family protein [Marichromatium sp. AB32]TCW34656.1 methylglutaconyl-CoA hydratase [Marichromatium gracile]
MPQTRLSLRIEAGVAQLRLARPERHNAFDDALIAELTETLQGLDRDQRVRCVVLGGEGASFSAGADIDWMRRMADYDEPANQADARALGALLSTLHRLAKPTLARVQGAAIGGGLGLVAACDLAFATADAAFALTEVRLGLIPAVIAPYVIAAIGPRQASRYMLTAERFDAAEAERIGLLHGISPDLAALDARIAEITAALAANGPEAMAAAKTLIRRVHGQPIGPELVEETARRIARIRVGAEAQEGLGAFLDKRAPRWRTTPAG